MKEPLDEHVAERLPTRRLEQHAGLGRQSCTVNRRPWPKRLRGPWVSGRRLRRREPPRRVGEKPLPSLRFACVEIE